MSNITSTLTLFFIDMTYCESVIGLEKQMSYSFYSFHLLVQ